MFPKEEETWIPYKNKCETLNPEEAAGRANAFGEDWLEKHEKYEVASSRAERKKVGYPEFKRWLKWCDEEGMEDMHNILSRIVETMANPEFKVSMEDPKLILGKEDIINEIERQLIPRKRKIKKKRLSKKRVGKEETDALKQTHEREGGCHKEPNGT